jgi:hypothetical protein
MIHILHARVIEFFDYDIFGAQNQACSLYQKHGVCGFVFFHAKKRFIRRQKYERVAEFEIFFTKILVQLQQIELFFVNQQIFVFV